MTFEELRRRYTVDELSGSAGDGELRYRIFAPFFRDLYESKLVYFERFICIVRLEEVKITPKSFQAVAIPHLEIERTAPFQRPLPTEPCEFESPWKSICLSQNALHNPYAGWTIWPEAAR